jgi:hypothetical protein
MPIQVKLVLPNNLNSSFLRAEFIDGGATYFTGRPSADPLLDTNQTTLVFGFQLTDSATRLPVALDHVVSLQMSNDPQFTPASTVTLSALPYQTNGGTGAAQAYQVALNPLYFFYPNDNTLIQSQGVVTGGSHADGTFELVGWPLSATGGLSTVYFKAVVAAVGGELGSYPDGYGLYDQIYWEGHAPTSPGVPTVVSTAPGWTGRKTLWRFRASEEGESGLYGTGVGRYVGDLLEVRGGQIQSTDPYAASMNRTILPSIAADVLSFSTYRYNSDSGAYAASSDSLPATVAETTGLALYGLNPVALNATSPDYGAQATVRMTALSGAATAAHYQIKIVEAAAPTSGSPSELVLTVDIGAETPPVATLAHASVSGQTQSTTLPQYAAAQLLSGGTLELYASLGASPAGAQMVVSGYFTPSGGGEAFLLANAVMPAFTATALSMAASGWATGGSATFMVYEMCQASGKFILDADLGDCDTDAACASTFPPTLTTSWVGDKAAGLWNTFQEPSGTGFSSASANLTLSAPLQSSGRAFVEAQAATPTFSDRAAVDFWVTHTGGDLYVAFSPVAVDPVATPASTRPMGTRCDQAAGMMDEPINRPTLAVVFSLSGGTASAVQRLPDNTLAHKSLFPYAPNGLENFVVGISNRSAEGVADGTVVTVKRNSILAATEQMDFLLPTQPNGLGWYVSVGVRSDRPAATPSGETSTFVTIPSAGAAVLQSTTILTLPPIVGYRDGDAPTVRHFVKGTDAAATTKALLGQGLLSSATDHGDYPFSSSDAATRVFAERLSLATVGSFLSTATASLLEVSIRSRRTGTAPGLPRVRLYGDAGGNIDATTPLTPWVTALGSPHPVETVSGAVVSGNSLVQFDISAADAQVSAGAPFWVCVELPSGCDIASANAYHEGSEAEIFTFADGSDLPSTQRAAPVAPATIGLPTAGTGWMVVTSLWHKLFTRFSRRHDNVVHRAWLQSRVRAVSHAGLASQGSVLSFPALTDLMAPGAPVQGLRADYFSGQFGTPLFSAIVPNIDAAFTNSDGSLAAGADSRLASPNAFSVRYSGMVTPAYSETYTFEADSEDGCRIMIGGMFVLDTYSSSGETAGSGQATLTAGQSYAVVVEYRSSGGSPSGIHLSWQSTSQATQVIPASAFAYASSRPQLTAQIPTAYRGVTATVRALDQDSGLLAFRVGREAAGGGVTLTNWQPATLFFPSGSGEYTAYLKDAPLALPTGVADPQAPTQDADYDGGRRVWLQVMDGVGNISESFPIQTLVQSTALVDTVPPVGGINYVNGQDGTALPYLSQPTATVGVDTDDRVTGVKDFRLRTLGAGSASAWGAWTPPAEYVNVALTGGDGLARLEAQFRDYGNNALQEAPLWDRLYASAQNGLIFIAMARWTAPGDSADALYMSGVKTQSYPTLVLSDSHDVAYGDGLAFYPTSYAAGTYGRRVAVRPTDRLIVTINGTPTTAYTIDAARGLVVFSQPPASGSVLQASLKRDSALIYRWDGQAVLKVADLGPFGERAVLSLCATPSALYLGGGSGNVRPFDGQSVLAPVFSSGGMPVTVLARHQFDHETQEYLYAATGNTPRLFRAPLSMAGQGASWSPCAVQGFLAGNSGSVSCSTSAFDTLFLGTLQGQVLRYKRLPVAAAADQETLGVSPLTRPDLSLGQSATLPVACLAVSGGQVLAGIGDRPEIWSYSERIRSLPHRREEWASQTFGQSFANDPTPWQYYTANGITNSRGTGSNLIPFTITDSVNDNGFRTGVGVVGVSGAVTILSADTGSDWEQAVGGSSAWTLEMDTMNVSGTGRQGFQVSDGRYFLDVSLTQSTLRLQSGSNSVEIPFAADSVTPFQVAAQPGGLVYPPRGLKQIWDFSSYPANPQQEDRGPYWPGDANGGSGSAVEGWKAGQFIVSPSTISAQALTPTSYLDAGVITTEVETNTASWPSTSHFLRVTPTATGDPMMLNIGVGVTVDTQSVVLIRVRVNAPSTATALYNLNGATIRVGSSETAGVDAAWVRWAEVGLKETSGYTTYSVSPGWSGSIQTLAIEFAGLPVGVNRPSTIDVDYIAIASDGVAVRITDNLTSVRIGVSGQDVTAWVGKSRHPLTVQTGFLKLPTSQTRLRFGKTTVETVVAQEAASTWAWGGLRFFVGGVVPPTESQVQDFALSARLPSAGGVRVITNYLGTAWALTDGLSRDRLADNPDDRAMKTFSYFPDQQVWRAEAPPLPRNTDGSGTIRPMCSTTFRGTLVVGGQQGTIRHQNP